MKQSKNKVAEYELYKRIKLLGEGAFGKAYLVECLEDKTKWVIKQMNIKAMSPEEQKETLKESKILEQFNHSNIVKFKEVYKTKAGNLCIVMEYADGGDLAQKVKQQRGKYFSENQILDWFVQVCLAIKHVHDRKVIHRDLKGQNIFLTKNNIIKLGDFGIARVLGRTMEKAKTMVGTPYYLSPEIIEQKPYSFKTDIWSLGVILYELCALRPPFNAESLHFLALKIVRGSYSPVPNCFSREMKDLIGSLLQVNPLKRPSIQQILQKPILVKRISNFMTESLRKNEFSHTVFHNQRINPNVKLSDFKQVNQEKPMPAHLLEKELKKKEEQRDEKQKVYQQQQQRQQQAIDAGNNYHYKQDAWQVKKEIEKREKEILKEKEQVRKKQIEQQRKDREKQRQKEIDEQKRLIELQKKRKEMERQAELQRQKDKREREKLLERERREMIQLEQKKKQEFHRQQIEKEQKQIRDMKEREQKYQQASREQFFSDRKQAEMNRLRAQEDQKGDRVGAVQYPEPESKPILNKKHSVQAVPTYSKPSSHKRNNSYDKKKPGLTKQEEERQKIEKIKQQKLEKMKANQEKNLKKLEEKNKIDQEEKQKVQDEKRKQREEERNQMRKDRAKWKKNQGGMNFELVTEKTESSNQEPSTEPSIQEEKKKPQKKKELNKWKKPSVERKKKNDDIPVEIFVAEKKPSKRNSSANQVSDEKLQEQKDRQKSVQVPQKEELRDDLSDMDDYDDEECKFEIDDKHEAYDSFNPNESREEDEDDDEENEYGQNDQEEEEVKKDSPQKNNQFSPAEQEAMENMLAEMNQLVGGALGAVEKIQSGNNLEDNNNANMFDFTADIQPPKNLRELDEKRKIETLQRKKFDEQQGGGSQQDLSDDREDDDFEPEMDTMYQQKLIEQSQEQERRKSKLAKQNKIQDKVKKQLVQEKCINIMHQDYSKQENLRMELEQKMGFDNFMKAYNIIKEQLNQQAESLETIEQLYGDAKYYEILPFLDKKDLEENIAYLITFIIMEENWEKEAYNSK